MFDDSFLFDEFLFGIFEFGGLMIGDYFQLDVFLFGIFEFGFKFVDVGVVFFSVMSVKSFFIIKFVEKVGQFLL